MDELLAVVPPIFWLAAQKSNPPDHTFNLSLCHQCAAHPRFWSQREHFICQILQLLHICICCIFCRFSISCTFSYFAYPTFNLSLTIQPVANVLHKYTPKYAYLGAPNMVIILLTDRILSHSPNFGRPKQGQIFV